MYYLNIYVCMYVNVCAKSVMYVIYICVLMCTYVCVYRPTVGSLILKLSIISPSHLPVVNQVTVT